MKTNRNAQALPLHRRVLSTLFAFALALAFTPGIGTAPQQAYAAAGELYKVVLTVDGASNLTTYSTKDILNLGKEVVATAKDSAGTTIDASTLTWSWYAGDSYYSSSVTEENRIEGATSPTFTPTDESLIGKYLFAQASNGTTPIASDASGRVVSEHAVNLYAVTVAGGTGGSVGVGDTLSATATKVVSVPNSSQTLQQPVEPGDDVTYQWQYSSTKSTSDSSFSDIEGATSSNYTITYDMAGKYLRVKVTGINTVVSTQKKQYGQTVSVDPLGPVQEIAGSMQLSSVAMSSSLGNSMWVGATVTPSANYLPQGSYVEQAVPSDAAVTYTWKVSDTESGPYAEFDPSAYPQSSLSATSQLIIGEDLLGKWVRLEANAHMNTVMSHNWRVLPQGVYDLLRITFSTSMSLFTGNRVNTTLQAKDLQYENDASFGITVPYTNPNIVYEWSYGPDASGSEWTVIPDSDVPDLLAIPEEAANNYLRVVARSSAGEYGTTVERVSSYKVLSGEALSSAPTRLDEVMYKPVPRWKDATNLNELVAAKLDSMGFAGVTVKTKSCTFDNTLADATVGVSAAEDETNGDVTFYSYTGDIANRPATSTIYRQAHVTFELTREGESPEEYSCTVVIPWDLDAADKIVDEQVKDLAIGFAQGDAADTVTQDMTLPCRTGILWTTWKSSNEDAIKVTGEWSWEDFTGVVHCSDVDQPVTLTATVDASLIDSNDDSLQALNRDIEFPVTVKGDAGLVEREIATIAEKVDANFTAQNLKASTTGATVYPDAVESDIQLFRPSALLSGLNTGKYRVAYSVEGSDAISINGYRANVFRPLPGSDPAEVALKVTVTHREIGGVTYSKSIPLKVKPLTSEELDEDLAYMEQVKSKVFEGLSEGKQEARAVTSDLHPFQRAYFTDDGTLMWQYDANDTAPDKYAIGFSRQTVDANPSSDESYSYFVSSSPYVATSTLRVLQRPQNDIGVGVTCCLSSDRFGDYYEHYKNDPAVVDADLGRQLQALNRQQVTAYFTLLGTAVNPAAAEELATAIDDTAAALEAVATSSDGSDVAEDKQWTDKDAHDALAEALEAARGVQSKNGVTSVEVIDAAKQLAKALEAFESACKPGLVAPAEPDEECDAAATPTFTVAPAAGKMFTAGKLKYKVTKEASAKEGAVAVAGFAKGAKKSGTLSIPAKVAFGDAVYKVTAIKAKAFKKAKIKKLVVGSNVATIGANAFEKCSKLAKATLGAKVKIIGKKAFYNCKKLKKLTFKGKKLKTVGKQAFKKTHKKLSAKAPKAKKGSYKNLLVKAGANKKIKVK